jgi:hypothetical protein
MALTDKQKMYAKRVRDKKSRIGKELRAAQKEREIVNIVIVQKYGLDQIEQEFAGLTEAEKLRLTYTELVRRLAIESHRNFISEVDWDDDYSVTKRKKQIENLKGMLTVTKMMNDLIINLEMAEGKNKVLSDDEKQAADNVISMAMKKLERAK